ncbi:MAG: hypothetical protein P8L85_04990 [Rubripirellula sp.]|nr:hypothetical protein [Rubripirellula sp.]
MPSKPLIMEECPWGSRSWDCGRFIPVQEHIQLSFEPFSVQCLTCGSRLRVTDPAIVGTIAACPKCASMVQIEQESAEATAAPQQVAVGHSDVDSQAITQGSIAAEQGDDLPEITDAHGFSGDSSSPTDDGLPPDWQSAGTRRTRQVVLISLLSVTGLIAAIVVFTWFVRSFGGGSTVADRETQVVDVDSGNAQDGAGTVEAQTDLNANGDAGLNANGDAGPNANGDAGSESAIDGATTESNPAEMDDVATAETSQDIAAPVAPPSDLIPQSPLDIPDVPTQPDVPGLMPVNPLANEPEPETGGMQALPPELEKYTRFLLDEGQVEETTLPAPPSMQDIEIDAAADQDFNSLGMAEPRELNLKGDLAIRMAFASDGYPLADLILLISQATGVPIQIDWVSFDLGGVPIDQQVTLVKGWKTARELLDLTADSLDAELRPEKTLLILTLNDESFQQTIGSLTDLGDFGAEKSSATAVLNGFLGANPELAKLALGETREQQQLAGLAVEGLRRMRGIPAKVPDVALSRWASGIENSVEWPLVTGGVAGPQADTPITLASLLRRTARRNQSTCIVNWYDAQRRGASPELVMIPHAKENAGAMLGDALKKFPLQARRVDAKHWWVGTEPTYDRLTAVVWTPPLGDSKDEFLKQIETIMQGASAETYRAAYDPVSDRALMLLPRFIVRQLPKIASSIAAN